MFDEERGSRLSREPGLHDILLFGTVWQQSEIVIPPPNLLAWKRYNGNCACLVSWIRISLRIIL